MSDEKEPAAVSPQEKPQNGVAGLKHLRHDILSGVVVSLVSLPLSSGIAIASGLPPIYGLTSAIIAGLVFPFIGGSYMTITGPAAGLAPAIMAVIISLGGAGNAEAVGAGYPFLLVVIFLVGCCQLVISLLGLARYASAIPVAVVEGMLASIGMRISLIPLGVLASVLLCTHWKVCEPAIWRHVAHIQTRTVWYFHADRCGNFGNGSVDRNLCRRCRTVDAECMAGAEVFEGSVAGCASET